MHRLIFIIALAASAWPAQATGLPTVISLNLCADAYLMQFAAKEQVLALTPQARDPKLSAFAAQANAFPVSGGGLEDILRLRPDLVIVSPYSDPMRNRLIRETGIEVLTLDAANDYRSARDEIVKLGAALGRAQHAAAYLARLDQTLAALPPRRDRPRLLPVQRRNLTAGRGHIVDDIITRAGGVNLGTAVTADTIGRISLETALAMDADYLVMNEAAAPDSRGAEFLLHPALQKRYPSARRIYLDNALLVCAGASTPLAIAALLNRLADQKTVK